jgi:hypothetical protein
MIEVFVTSPSSKDPLAFVGECGVRGDINGEFLGDINGEFLGDIFGEPFGDFFEWCIIRTKQ